MPKFINLIGQKFNMLTVVERVGYVGKDITYKCVCDCGKEKIAVGKSVRKGHTKSCGCAYKIAADKRNETPKHGHARRGKTSPEYSSWGMMRNRCTNPNVENWMDYGGRGITICPQWLGEGGFERFLADMGPRPSRDHWIEREDSNGNYEPGNCRWLHRSKQMKNRRSTVFIEHDGKRLCISDWEIELGLKSGVIHGRVKNLRMKNLPLHLAIFKEGETPPWMNYTTASSENNSAT